MESPVFYNDIYHLPLVDNRIYKSHWRRPRLKSSIVQDESKVTQIVDAKGNVRYRIILSSKDVDGQIGYKIEVVHYYPGDEENGGQIIQKIPAEDDTLEFDYSEAEVNFHFCVQQYDSLVKAETRDFKDIEIYKDKINYRVITPDCCGFCIWSHESYHHCQHRHALECHNPKNQQKFSYIVDYPPFDNPNAHRYCRPDSWRKLPWQDHIPQTYADYEYEHRKDCMRDDSTLNRIFPHVDFLGVCDNFEQAGKRPNAPGCDCPSANSDLSTGT